MRHRPKLLVAAIAAIAMLIPVQIQAITGQGIGIRAGFVFDYDQPVLDDEGIEPKDLSMYGAHATILSISKLSVEGAVEYAYRDYWREIINVVPGEDALLANVQFKVRDYAVYLTGRYKLIQGNFGVHLGGGLNFHRMTYSLELTESSSWVGQFVGIPENGWHSGLHGLVGISLGLPTLPFRVFGEARLAKVSVEGEAGQQATFLGGVTFGSF